MGKTEQPEREGSKYCGRGVSHTNRPDFLQNAYLPINALFSLITLYWRKYKVNQWPFLGILKIIFHFFFDKSCLQRTELRESWNQSSNMFQFNTEYIQFSVICNSTNPGNLQMYWLHKIIISVAFFSLVGYTGTNL
jgi:hypothetical protein